MPSPLTSSFSFTDYRPGLIGRVTEAHAVYYHRRWGFDLSFERQVAGEMAEFFTRFDPARDLFQAALAEGLFAGSVALDGGHPHGPRLRWLLVEPDFQGRGLGWALLSRAVDFARQAGHGRLHLWTFAGLDAARRLYERIGFQLAEEHRADQWGGRIAEQKFTLVL